MVKKELSPRFLSEFCMELSLLIRAGITVSDGLSAMSEDFDDSTGFLVALRDKTSGGETLTQALEKTGMAPQYMLDSVRLGERTGRIEACLKALSEYYARRANLIAAVRSALLYPFVLIIMLAAVMAILVTKVLPIFSEVFEQMGVELYSFTAKAVAFGQWLAKASAVIIGVFAVILLAAFVIYAVPATKKSVGRAFRRRFGGCGMFREALTAQFASAMATAISSGLTTEESVELAGKVVSGVKATDDAIVRCREMLKNGESLEKSLASTGVFTARDSRLLTLGVRTGTADTVMAEIARRSEERALEDIDIRLGRIEPTLVVIISVVVGAVLLSVMLPLTGIMSSLG